MVKSSNKSAVGQLGPRPKKPYAEFPLFPHATRRWAKKIRGKFYYFGPWSDPDAALTRFLAQRDYLLAGVTPPDTREGLTVRELCNEFLTAKERKRDIGEITRRTFTDHHATCRNIIGALGRDQLVDRLQPGDFAKWRDKLARRVGPVTLANEIQRVRVVFKYAYDARLIERPVFLAQTSSGLRRRFCGWPVPPRDPGCLRLPTCGRSSKWPRCH